MTLSLFGLDLREVRLASIGWTLFLATQVAFCSIYTHVTTTAPWEVRHMLAWGIKHWGIWLILTPLVLREARRHERWLRGRFSRYAMLAGAVLVVSLPVRITLELLVSGEATMSNFWIYLPRHLAAIAGILLVWRYFLRDRFQHSAPPGVAIERNDVAASTAPTLPGKSNGRETPAALSLGPTIAPADERAALVAENSHAIPEIPQPILRRVDATPELLRVNKGRDECLIAIEQIEFVTSAGNYVDIGCAGQVYLLRATLKQMEQRLPSTWFVRIHRRHLVNLRAIERITWRRSGNGIIRLKSGPTLNVSKTFKNRLAGDRDV